MAPLNPALFPGAEHANSFAGHTTAGLSYRYNQVFGTPEVVTSTDLASGYGLECSGGEGVEAIITGTSRVDGDYAWRESSGGTIPSGYTGHGLGLSLVIPAFEAPDHLVLAEWWDHDSTQRAHALWLYSDGRLSLRGGGGQSVATAAGVFQFGRRCHVEIGMFLHPYVGAAVIGTYGYHHVIRINGSFNTAENNLLQASLLRYGNLVADNSVAVLIGDVYATGTDRRYDPRDNLTFIYPLGNTAWVPGHMALQWLLPYGHATITQPPDPWIDAVAWVGGPDYQKLDDASPDGDTTYIATAAPDEPGAGLQTTVYYLDRYLFGPLAALSPTIDLSEGIAQVIATAVARVEEEHTWPGGWFTVPITGEPLDQITGVYSTDVLDQLYRGLTYQTTHANIWRSRYDSSGTPTYRDFLAGDLTAVNLEQHFRRTNPPNAGMDGKPYRVTQLGLEVCHQLPIYTPPALPPPFPTGRLRTRAYLLG